MKVLISGAGMAGLTLAYWLKRYGFVPTIIEKHPGLRTEGQFNFEMHRLNNIATIG